MNIKLDGKYTVRVVKDVGETYSGWFADVIELPGCMTQADTFAELLPMIYDAIESWIATAIEDGVYVEHE